MPPKTSPVSVPLCVGVPSSDGFSPRRNSVRLIIRKIQFAPMKTGPAPKAETTRQFMMSDKPLHLEASLDREVSTGAVPCPVPPRAPPEMGTGMSLSPFLLAGRVTGSLLTADLLPRRPHQRDCQHQQHHQQDCEEN